MCHVELSLGICLKRLTITMKSEECVSSLRVRQYITSIQAEHSFFILFRTELVEPERFGNVTEPCVQTLQHTVQNDYTFLHKPINSCQSKCHLVYAKQQS
jgi:hypothetical protein